MHDEDVEYVDALCLDSDTVRLDEEGYMGIDYEDDFDKVNSPILKIADFFVPWPDGTIRFGSY